MPNSSVIFLEAHGASSSSTTVAVHAHKVISITYHGNKIKLFGKSHQFCYK
ncbi:MAG: hypothetical protein KA998_01010 [Rickettsiaceae bacterium]|nr:hypothetical protein [Rickettsiaceae bacterium]